MPKAVRIVAEHAGNHQQAADPGYSLVFDAIVDGERIRPDRYFGVSFEEKARWPFTLERPIADDDGYFDFGEGSGDEVTPLRERTNIFSRAIAPGELFTRWWETNEEWTYRITQVIDLAYRA